MANKEKVRNNTNNIIYNFVLLSLDSQSNSAAMPAPTLEFASLCLQNALFLLPSMSAIAAAQGLCPIEEDWSGEPKPLDGPQHVTALPGPPIKGDSIMDLRYMSCDVQ